MINIKENGQYKNLVLKTKYKRNGKMLVFEDGKKVVAEEGLADGESVVVKKLFAEGRPNNGQYGVSYSCKVECEDQEVTFWLSEKEHTIYQGLGGEGDSVKITLKVEQFTNPINGTQGEAQRLSFEKVE